jgi:hypothetical protein
MRPSGMLCGGSSRSIRLANTPRDKGVELLSRLDERLPWPPNPPGAYLSTTYANRDVQ